MPAEPESIRSKSSVDQLEAQWLRNEVPDIAAYLRSPPAPDSVLCHDLIELDLEYRWKRFRKDDSSPDRDLYGFPQFPTLEDYAGLLDDSQRHLVLTPELLAEEYRVRRTWGDRPDKQEYLSRLPLDSVAIESALNQIDTEFEIERATPVEQEDSSHLADESTWLVGKQDQPDERRARETEPPHSIGKYELKELLGRGGFGEVWKAFDPDLKRYVALKFPRRDKRFTPEILKYFRREAQKMATLERVLGIVPVYEAGEADGRIYIVSYLVQGEDLGKIFNRGELSYEDSARIVAEVAETLHRAHLKNLFHRDVKLSNILIGDDGDIFLSDFGLCVSEEEQLQEGHSTTGTYAYMAPEQVQGYSHRLDGRADIYALGVVLYRLLTGRLPFLAETPQEYLQQVLQREPRPPRSIKDDIPAELERICLKCMNKDIKHRYTTAADLAGELRQSFSSVSKSPTPPKKAATVAISLVCITFLALTQIDFSDDQTSDLNTVEKNSDDDKVEVRISPRKGELTVVPAKVYSSGSSLDNHSIVNKISNSLQLISQNLFLVKLGRLDDSDKTLRVTMRLSDTNHEAGVFVGFRDRTVDDRQQFQLIRLVRRPDGGTVSLRTIRLMNHNSVSTSEIFEYNDEFVAAVLPENTIEIHFDSGKLSRIFWNDKLVENVVQTPIDTPELRNVTGLFGVFTDETSAIFSEIQINGSKLVLAE